MTETNARELNTSGFNRYMVECEFIIEQFI